MKKLGAIFICFFVVLAVAWGLWVRLHGAGESTASGSVAAPARPAPPVSKLIVTSVVKPAEWQEFQSDRDTTLKSDPDIASTYKALLDEMMAQQKALDAAMLKADPNVAPALAKLELVRKHVLAPDSTAAAPKFYQLTPAEGQEIQAARMAALKAHPAFDQQAMQLAAKMQAMQQQVEAAMVKGDPNVAAVLAKFQTSAPAAPLPKKQE